MVYSLEDQLRILESTKAFDRLNGSAYLWSRLSGSYGIDAAAAAAAAAEAAEEEQESPASSPLDSGAGAMADLETMPTLFLGAPSKSYTDELVEEDWRDVQDYLTPRRGVAPEGFITDAAPDAVSLIETHIRDKWADSPRVRLVFCGVVTDVGNVWEFADGSVVPFSQFASVIESREGPLALDVISGTPTAADWSAKIKAFNAKNAPHKVINLFVPEKPGRADREPEDVAQTAPKTASSGSAKAPVTTAAPAAAAAAPENDDEDPEQRRLRADALLEAAKKERVMEVISDGLKIGPEKRCTERFAKYEKLRKNKYWYDFPYHFYPDWKVVPYHPTYSNYYYPWRHRPGFLKKVEPFGGLEDLVAL